MSVQSAAKYVFDTCTYYVAKTLAWVPAGWGNAKDWLGNAQRMGYPTSRVPHPGDVAVYGPGHGYDPNFGHVAVVENVLPGQKFTVAEMTAGRESRTRVSSMQDVLGFIRPPQSQQNEMDVFTAWLKGLSQGSGNAAGSLANFADVSAASSNPLDWPQQVEHWMASWAWRAVLITLGLVMVLLGIYLLFKKPIDVVVNTAGKAAEAASVAAA